MFTPVDTLYTDIPFPDFPERLQNELLTVPHKTERPDDVAHAEQVDPGGPSQEDDVQGHPVHVGEEAALDHVQIGPVDTRHHNTAFIHSNNLSLCLLQHQRRNWIRSRTSFH